MWVVRWKSLVKKVPEQKCLEASDLHSVATEYDHVEVAVLVNRFKKK